MKKSGLAILTFIGVLLHSVWAFSFSVDQSSLHVTTAKGSEQTYAIVVRNDNETPLTVKAYVRDWTYTDTGAKQFVAPGTSPYSCANWLRVSPEQFVVPAKSAKQVDISLRTPQDAVGGHQAVVFFETDVPDIAVSENILQYAARIGVIVYQDTEKASSYDIAVADTKASKVGDKVYYRLVLQNAGNVWNNALVNVSVLNGDDVVQQIQKGPYAFLPQEKTIVEGVFSGVAQATQVVYVVEDYRHKLIPGDIALGAEAIVPVSETTTPVAVSNDIPEEQASSVAPEQTVTPTVGGVELVDYAVKFQPQTRDLKVYVKLKAETPQTAKAFVKVTNADGVRVKTVELNAKRVVPEKPAQMVVLWPIYNDLPSGEYQCELSLIVNGETLTKNRTVRW